MKEQSYSDYQRIGASECLNRTKASIPLFYGIAESIMPRSTGCDFFNLGRFLERANNLSRLIDVKCLSSPRTEMRNLERRNRKTGKKEVYQLPPLWTGHADFANPFEFCRFMRDMRGLEFDVMLESKSKDLAVIRLRPDLRTLRNPDTGNFIERSTRSTTFPIDPASLPDASYGREGRRHDYAMDLLPDHLRTYFDPVQQDD